MEVIVQITLFGTVILVTSWFGRPVWFLVQGIQLIGLAILYLFSPSFTFDTVLRMMIGEFDHLHSLVIRSLAIWYISQAFFILYYRNSTDNRFLDALVRSQIVAYFLETIAHLPYLGKGHLSPTILHFPDKGLIFPAYFMVANLVQFVMMSGSQTTDQTNRCQRSCLHARIDGVAMLILGTSLFAFPKEIVSFTMNRTDFYCDSIVPAATLGSYIIYCGLLSLQSDTFEKAEYKKHVNWTRIAECFLFTVLIAYYWIFSDLFNSNVVWVLLVFVMLLCNAGLAIRNTPDDKMKI